MMIMEWDQQQENQSQNQREDSVNLNVNNGVMYVKVMTDEQLETLRKQIAVYASICEQLVEMHKNLTAQQDLTGGRLGNLYCDPLMTSGGHKISARQRWTPTAVQLQILERIFDEGTGTPSKQKIKEITSELSQHGPISETNVYNWFQNRRARSKRKQVMVASSSNNNNNHNHAGESEVETEVESPRTKPENLLLVSEGQGQHHDVCFQNPEITSQLHFLGVGDDHMCQLKEWGEAAFMTKHGRVSE
ncbi:hypothetical protein ERO13_D03G001900v2 [Gossypium hirsutum]|uniref:WUSCHEL-related homeobox 13 n=1 Tax=Gossypium hirsutum TaxID=3635 RepID=A0A1U8ML49_GOSHI|nr:WUSCHEL-related homeobox 13 [Gossypium hirsutum]KAG4153614.1 hypothetical protein ERO13_D03G001900v2 [Gossypium hirsutum]